MARPTDYTEELAEIICERVALTRTVVEALSVAGMPDPSTVYRWIIRYPEFRKNYEAALSFRAEADNEELRRVAYDLDMPNDHKRTIVDVLKWQQARANPKRYGDKIQQELSGPNGGPVEVGVDVSKLSAEQLAVLAGIGLK